MKRFLRHHGLTLVLGALFVLALFGGQFNAGWRAYNDERREQGQPPVGAFAYLRSAHFLEATMENWESEFFQMFMYVILTVRLYQKGSAESHDPDHPRRERVPTPAHAARSAPWPVRRGGRWLGLYSHSLSMALCTLFLISFTLHALSGTALYNEERLARGEPPLDVAGYMMSARFWFESFQNWQSEFFAIAAMVVLTIFLRERDSPESKPVAAPHHECGE